MSRKIKGGIYMSNNLKEEASNTKIDYTVSPSSFRIVKKPK